MFMKPIQMTDQDHHRLKDLIDDYRLTSNEPTSYD